MEGDAGTGRLTPTPATPEAVNSDTEDPDTVSSDTKDPDTEDTDTVDPDTEDPDTDGSAAGDSDTPADAAEPRSGSRLRSRGWLVGVSTSLVLLSAALIGGGYALVRANHDNRALVQAEAEAVRAAKDCVTATQAPDTAAMAASQQKIIDCATGDFEVQATIYSGVLVDAYQAANAKVTVSDMRAAAEHHNPDGSIDVLVALRVTTSNSELQDQETGYRLRVRMAPDDGTYKIARLDQVTK